MKRDEQMMNAAEAYAAGLYADEPVSFSTEEDRCVTMNDFCAGWYAADRCSRWIPVEERLPEHCDCLLYTEPRNIHGPFEGRFRFGFYNYADQRWEIQGEKWDNTIVTHWMPIMPPRKEVKNDKERNRTTIR